MNEPNYDTTPDQNKEGANLLLQAFPGSSVIYKGAFWTRKNEAQDYYLVLEFADGVGPELGEGQGLECKVSVATDQLGNDIERYYQVRLATNVMMRQNKHAAKLEVIREITEWRDAGNSDMHAPKQQEAKPNPKPSTKPAPTNSMREDEILGQLNEWGLDISDKTHIGRATQKAAKERAAKLEALRMAEATKSVSVG